MNPSGKSIKFKFCAKEEKEISWWKIDSPISQIEEEINELREMKFSQIK